MPGWRATSPTPARPAARRFCLVEPWELGSGLSPSAGALSGVRPNSQDLPQVSIHSDNEVTAQRFCIGCDDEDIAVTCRGNRLYPRVAPVACRLFSHSDGCGRVEWKIPATAHVPRSRSARLLHMFH